MKVECPKCPGYPTEQDEDGRWYSCYCCGDTGWIDVMSDKEVNAELRIAAKERKTWLS